MGSSREASMTANRKTPNELAITPRDLTFGEGAAHERHWLAGDPVATAFYNALSATFPLGERFFMDSVRRYGHLAGPPLDGQIAAFLAQEAVHSREHLLFNSQVAGHGYDVAAMEARTRARIAFVKTRPPIAQLAATVALEHFTAILAHAVLADPRHFEGVAPEARALWRWHAMEEIEHKSVAFDTFCAASRDMPAIRRWALRTTAMAFATVLLFSNVFASMGSMFRTDGIDRIATWGRVMGFLFGRPGILRQALPSYLGYYAPGFHPWMNDDRALIVDLERTLAAAQPGVA
jgi:predicted metal-dependent hydrolase